MVIVTTFVGKIDQPKFLSLSLVIKTFVIVMIFETLNSASKTRHNISFSTHTYVYVNVEGGSGSLLP